MTRKLLVPRLEYGLYSTTTMWVGSIISKSTDHKIIQCLWGERIHHQQHHCFMLTWCFQSTRSKHFCFQKWGSDSHSDKKALCCHDSCMCVFYMLDDGLFVSQSDFFILLLWFVFRPWRSTARRTPRSKTTASWRRRWRWPGRVFGGQR